jgi:5-methylcytosine-specific restriction endonuclease McrA
MRRLSISVRRRARNVCEACGAPALPGRSTVDHRVPVALGGPSTMENLQLLCRRCDDAKTKLDLATMRALRSTR